MIVEVGNRQPRTLANAFRNEVPLKGDVGKEALKAMSEHVLSFDLTYGPAEVRAGFCVGDGLRNLEAMKAVPKTLAGLSDWVRTAIGTGQA